LETNQACTVNTAGEGVHHAAAGREGGTDAAPHHYQVRDPDGSRLKLRTKQEGLTVQAGSVFEVHSGGGGGWGKPADRSAEARALDASEGLPPYLGDAAIDEGAS
jgi:N-methylhydantoinase B